jgi:hypothetical protein
MAPGTSRAHGARRGRDMVRTLVSILAILAGLVVVGGGIALFLSALIR